MHITTISKFCKKHAGLPEGKVRWDVYNAHNNGLREAGAVFRKGRSVFIFEEKYLSWLTGMPEEQFIEDHNAKY